MRGRVGGQRGERLTCCGSRSRSSVLEPPVLENVLSDLRAGGLQGERGLDRLEEGTVSRVRALRRHWRVDCGPCPVSVA